MRIERIDPPEHGFYGKQIDVFGSFVKAHAEVEDEALWEAARRIARLLVAAPRLASNLASAGAELHVIGRRQRVTDLPMYRHMQGVPFKDGMTMDERGKGYGGLHCCCSEDSILKLPSARHHRDHRDIASHEFAHAIDAYGLDGALRAELETCYERSKHLWGEAYAASNAREYFAELTMWYVGSRGDYSSLPRPEPGPDWLARHDPDGFRLLDGIYSGRVEPEPIEWEVLESSAARSSGASLFPVSVLFVNETDEPIERFWLDTEGTSKPYGPIPPGSAVGQSTFAGHAWALVAADGRELGVYVPSGPPHALVRIEAHHH